MAAKDLVPWRPGQSGNPGGRPKIPEEVKEALKAMTPRAVAVLGELLESDDDRVRIAAVNTVLDRSLGKPVAALEVSGPDGQPLAARNTHFDWSKLSASEFSMMRDLLMKGAVSRETSQVIDVTTSANLTTSANCTTSSSYTDSASPSDVASNAPPPRSDT